MKRTIGMALAVLASATLACGEEPHGSDIILPPEPPKFEYNGIPLDRHPDDVGVQEEEYHALIVQLPPEEMPPMPDIDELIDKVRNRRGGMRIDMSDMPSDSIIESEMMTCDDEGCYYETVYTRPDGSFISDQELQRLNFRGRNEIGRPGSNQHVVISPPNYWDTGADDVPPSVAAVSGGARNPGAGTGSPLTGSATAACTAGPDLCQIGFSPWCNGGSGKVSPGGIAESSSGCRGSTIKHGGPGQERPDNMRVRISYWNGLEYSCNQGFGEMIGLDWVVNWLNDRDKILPPPWELVPEGCSTLTANAGLPKGWKQCEGDPYWICVGDAATYGTLVDISIGYAELYPGAMFIDQICPGLGGTGPGGNRANSKTTGCTSRRYEMNSSGPVIRTWNNGYRDYSYWTMRGALVSIDPGRVRWGANRPASELDRGNTSVTDRIGYFSIHAIAHEIGHAIGLEHAYAGPDGSPRWIPHSRLSNAMTLNPNLMPHSVMLREMPAAPYTLASWSSGLAANLVDWDPATAGAGNAEAWKLSNMARATRGSEGQDVPKNTYGPPITATSNEL